MKNYQKVEITHHEVGIKMSIPFRYHYIDKDMSLEIFDELVKLLVLSTKGKAECFDELSDENYVVYYVYDDKNNQVFDITWSDHFCSDEEWEDIRRTSKVSRGINYE